MNKKPTKWHACEWCGLDGCESCMVSTIDGWAHRKKCADALKDYEDRRDQKLTQTRVN